MLREYTLVMKVLKSVGAVVAGFLTVVVLSIATDAILEAVGFFPPATKPEEYASWMLLIALIYRTVFTVLGGFVTAKLAPFNPKKHVIVLAVLGTIGGIAGVINGWSYGNHWYPIALAVLAFPSVWYGGKLATNKSKPRKK